MEKKINTLYNYHGYSITELCKACDISRQQFYNIRDGKSEPSVFTALKIARFFDKPVDYVFQLVEY